MIKLHIEFLIFKSGQVSNLELLILRFEFGYLQDTQWIVFNPLHNESLKYKNLH